MGIEYMPFVNPFKKTSKTPGVQLVEKNGKTYKKVVSK